jgi:hypothetical protein
VLAACLISGIALSACSTPSTSGTAANTTGRIPNTALCASVHRIDQLIVQRTTGQPPRLFAFPARVSVGNRGAAEQVATAMCALPDLPGGTHCPRALAVSYRLYFGHLVHTVGSGGDGHSDYWVSNSVTFNPTGCQVLHGLGSARWIARHRSFYRTLGAAMKGWVGLTPIAKQHLAKAGEETFAGTQFVPAGYQPPKS